jgi:medium-chain acyl-[acyl-carrier-protein] hydrolase
MIARERPAWWVVRRRDAAALRLFCFPYAGAGTSAFRGWHEALPPDVEVCSLQLPGRGSRLGEPAFRRMTPLVEALAEGVRAALGTPIAFFGHSMGALVAFELAREMRRRGWPAPRHLFVSGLAAPHLPDPAPTRLHRLTDGELVAELRRLGGTPPAVLESPEILELTLPTLRADFELLETYRYEPEPPLDCDLTALGGQDDRFVTPGGLAAWAAETSGRFTRVVFPGNHFFLHSAAAAVLRTVSDHLRASGDAGARKHAEDHTPAF